MDTTNKEAKYSKWGKVCRGNDRFLRFDHRMNGKKGKPVKIEW